MVLRVLQRTVLVFLWPQTAMPSTREGNYKSRCLCPGCLCPGLRRGLARRDDALGSPNALAIDIHLVCGLEIEVVDTIGESNIPHDGTVEYG